MQEVERHWGPQKLSIFGLEAQERHVSLRHDPEGSKARRAKFTASVVRKEERYFGEECRAAWIADKRPKTPELLSWDSE